MRKLNLFECAQLLGGVQKYYQDCTKYPYDESNATNFAVFHVMGERKEPPGVQRWVYENLGANPADYTLTQEDLYEFIEEEYVPDTLIRLNELYAQYQQHYGKTT